MTENHDLLQQANNITQEMRRLEQRIKELNSERRGIIRAVWKGGTPQRVIAQSLNLTNQTIWNEIHRKDNANELVAQ